MDLVATVKEMQAADRAAIKGYHIPGILLMENAGRSVSEAIERDLGPITGKLVYVVCGKGNNGGDGFVVARHLLSRGAKVMVFLIGRAVQVKGDAKVNLNILREIEKGRKNRNLQFIENATSKLLKKQPEPDVIVDALFGTGFSGAPRGEYERVIHWVNDCKAKRVSIDIPSGIDADNGTAVGVSVKADVTVTMGLHKVGLLVNKGRDNAGKVRVADLGIPRVVYEGMKIKTFLVSREDVRGMLPRRPIDAHKHSVGKIFILAGSRGLTGAAVMCSNSAMRAGAGAVVLGIPKSLLPVVSKKLTEVMTTPLEETDEQSVSTRARDEIARYLDWAGVVVVGPGLGRNKESQELILDLIKTCSKPMLLDADGLNALSLKPAILKKRRGQTILTPHAGELSRLIRVGVDEIENNRVGVAREWATKHKAILVLKGAPTVTGLPTGEVYINSSGNPGMATAGAGDVLTGTIAALWGQHLEAGDVAVTGVFIHGLAGDIARDEFGELSLVATDIIGKIPDAFKETQTREGN